MASSCHELMSTKTRTQPFEYQAQGEGYVIAIFWGATFIFSGPVCGGRVGTDLRREEVIVD